MRQHLSFREHFRREAMQVLILFAARHARDD
jgi:hypothetical protein